MSIKKTLFVVFISIFEWCTIDSSIFGFASLLASQMRIMQNELRKRRRLKGLAAAVPLWQPPYSFFRITTFHDDAIKTYQRDLSSDLT